MFYIKNCKFYKFYIRVALQN